MAREKRKEKKIQKKKAKMERKINKKRIDGQTQTLDLDGILELNKKPLSTEEIQIKNENEEKLIENNDLNSTNFKDETDLLMAKNEELDKMLENDSSLDFLMEESDDDFLNDNNDVVDSDLESDKQKQEIKKQEIRKEEKTMEEVWADEEANRENIEKQDETNFSSTESQKSKQEIAAEIEEVETEDDTSEQLNEIKNILELEEPESEMTLKIEKSKETKASAKKKTVDNSSDEQKSQATKTNNDHENNPSPTVEKLPEQLPNNQNNNNHQQQPNFNNQNYNGSYQQPNNQVQNHNNVGYTQEMGLNNQMGNYNNPNPNYNQQRTQQMNMGSYNDFNPNYNNQNYNAGYPQSNNQMGNYNQGYTQEMGLNNQMGNYNNPNPNYNQQRTQQINLNNPNANNWQQFPLNNQYQQMDVSATQEFNLRNLNLGPNQNWQQNLAFENIVDVRNLTLDFEDRRVLDNINFNVKQGSFHVLIGENGSGKTSLIRALLGIYTNFHGQILLNNKPIYAPESVKIAFYFSTNPIFPKNLSLLKYLEIKYVNFEYNDVNKDVLMNNYLKKFNLWKNRNSLLENLSSGEKKKLLIVEALLFRAKLWILDDFTANLDYQTKEEIYRILLEEKQRNNITIIMSTHDLGNISNYATSASFIYNGNIFWNGDVRSERQWIKRYFDLLEQRKLTNRQNNFLPLK